jgi:hypothetical protein
VLKAYLANVLSIGVGAYYATYSGDMKETTKTLSGSSTSNRSFAAASHEKSDFGLVTSLGIYIPISPVSRIILDGRYNIGMKDNNTSAAELKYNDIQALLGIQFGI